MATTKNYPYRKPNIGDIYVAGPKDDFTHRIIITKIINDDLWYKSDKYGESKVGINLIQSAIEEGYWKYKYNFNHYLKQAELL